MVASIDEESRIGCDTDNSAGSYPTVGEGTRPNQIGVRRSVYMYPVLGVACAQCIISGCVLSLLGIPSLSRLRVHYQ